MLTDNREQPAGGVETERLEAILAGCEGVTPGPWNVSPHDPFLVEDEGDLEIFATTKRRPFARDVFNAAYIARLDPQTVASIITELLAYRRRPPADAGKADSGEAKPVAWIFELAGARMKNGTYVNWGEPQLSFTEPCVPEGSIRNLRALGALPSAPDRLFAPTPTPPVPVSEDAVEAAGFVRQDVLDALAELGPPPAYINAVISRAPTLSGRAPIYATAIPHMARWWDQGAGAVPIAWRCEDLILPGVSFTDDARHAAARAGAKMLDGSPAWLVQPLYATPTDQVTALVEAARELLDNHVMLVSCGDCGNWDVESEPEVRILRKALLPFAKAPAPDDTTPSLNPPESSNAAS